MPNLNITLHHSSGAVTAYKPGDPSKGGVHEAILVCMDREKAADYPLGIVRADLPGAAWTSLLEANGIQAVSKAMISSAQDILGGFVPKVFFDIDSAGGMSNARMVGTEIEERAEVGKTGVRSLAVPANLPYQMGGDDGGASIVIYKSEGTRGIQIHSIHPTTGEASVAEHNLKTEADVTSAVIRASTPVTRIVQSALNGHRFDDTSDDISTPSGGLPTAFPSAVSGVVRASMDSPTPFPGV